MWKRRRRIVYTRYICNYIRSLWHTHDCLIVLVFLNSIELKVGKDLIEFYWYLIDTQFLHIIKLSYSVRVNESPMTVFKIAELPSDSVIVGRVKVAATRLAQLSYQSLQSA